MSLAETIESCGIESVVHFTTNRGALGVLASGFLKSRARLNVDDQLRHIFQPNAENRNKDIAWLDYVNMSISRINGQFFKAAGAWHRQKDFWWCILSFDPVIMTHEGVVFATTNNMYTGVRRLGGEEGFLRLFDDQVTLWGTKVIARPEGHPPYLTTCPQAEFLYPEQVSTDYLREIFVRTAEDGDELAAQIRAVGHREVLVSVRPQMFGEIV